jgi:hypothetical protein
MAKKVSKSKASKAKKRSVSAKKGKSQKMAAKVVDPFRGKWKVP